MIPLGLNFADFVGWLQAEKPETWLSVATDAYVATRLLWCGKSFVFLHELVELLFYCYRQRRGSTEVRVDMKRELLRCRGKIIVLIVVQVLKEVQAFFVVVHELKRHPYGITND